MEKNENSLRVLAPVMLSFFVMGMVDIVGVATNFVRNDFGLGAFAASALPMMVFLWFAVFSIPAGLLLNKYGQKTIVALSIVLNTVALILPSLHYTFPTVLIAFVLLGIGNTILQVAINPLVANMVSDRKLAGMLTFGQFTKAIASFLGPILATLAASFYGDWKLALLLYAFISACTAVYLFLTPIEEKEQGVKTSSFGKILRLLADRSILLLFMGIVVLVGIDVSMNTFSAQLLMQKLGMATEEAGLSSSVYFGARTFGAFLGSILLLRIAVSRFFKINMLAAILGVGLLVLTSDYWSLFLGIVIVGFCCANVFSILFTYALQLRKDKQNEVSSLMIMGVAGGAIIPPMLGFIAQQSTISFGFSLLFVLVIYLLTIAIRFSNKKAT